MKHIIFMNHALTGTGGSRVILNLSDKLVKKGIKVSILIDRNLPIDFDIPEGVDVYFWGAFGIKPITMNRLYLRRENIYKKETGSKEISLIYIKSFIKWLYYLTIIPLQTIAFINFYRRNKVDLAIQNNIYNALERNYFIRLFCNVRLNFHNSPTEVFSRPDFRLFCSTKRFFKNFFNYAVSKDISEELTSKFNVPKKQSCSIYNGFNFEEIINNSEFSDVSLSNFNLKEDDYFISVSTLTERKRLDRLIKSYRKYLIKSNKPKKLLILGVGPLEKEIKKLCNKYRIDEYVVFGGFQKNPYYFMRNSSCLILTSDSEGLPTVLIESLILNTPVISTECPTGPKEILLEGNKYLVDIGRQEEFIESDIANLMCSIGHETYNFNSLERFSDDVIANKWMSEIS